MKNDPDLLNAKITTEFTGEELIALARCVWLALTVDRIEPKLEKFYTDLQHKVEAIISEAKKAVHDD